MTTSPSAPVSAERAAAGSASGKGKRPRRLPADLRYPPLLALVAVGVAVRALLMGLYFPALMLLYDSPRFARTVPGQTALFDDFWMPAGYPVFLKALRVPTDQVWFTIAAQHLLGVVTALAVYLALRRLELPRWCSCLPIAALLLAGDVLYLEHILMADQLMLVLALLACAATVFALVPRTDHRWLTTAGAVAAGAAVTRSVGLVVVIAVALTVVAGVRGPWVRRLGSAGLVVAGAAVVFALYGLAYEVKDGRYLGFGDMRGWNLYARVATFADCSRFTPPAGTSSLCERAPPKHRPGGLYYSWDLGSFTRRTFAQDPSTDGRFYRFAKKAIVSQPGDYAAAVLTDLARYVEPTVGPDRPYSGQPREIVWFGWRDAGVERTVTRGLDPKYDGVGVSAPGMGFFGTYQNVLRVDRLMVLLLLAATLAGVAWGRGPARLGALLFGLTSLGLFVLPTMTLSYDFRYGIPATTLLTVAGASGAWALWLRVGRRALSAPR